MNLVLLVEGAATEPEVYRAWLRQHLPMLQEVNTVAELTTQSYVLVQGMGNPSYLRRIGALLRDIDAHPERVQAFSICIDSEEATYQQRYDKIAHAVAEGKYGTRLAMTNPALDVRILVQHCCIETWFLGHDGFARAATQSRDIVAFKRFFDVTTSDPEQMGKDRGGGMRPRFHLKYLQAMLAEHGYSYSKGNPGIVLAPSYFEALDRRCARTGHLASFQKLLDALRAAGAAV